MPDQVWLKANEIADLAATTPNDVLVSFALKGMRVAESELETARIARERVASYRSGGTAGAHGELPSLEEAIDASKLLRVDASRE